MRLRTGALLLPALLVLVLAVPLLGNDLPDWLMRTGSVYDAMQKQPGTHVYLDAVVVDKVKAQASPPYFTIREEFAPFLRLAILSPPSPSLRIGQVVDVEGDVVVLPGNSGQMGLENVTVWGYADEDGATIITGGGPLIKGLLGPMAWPYMLDITVQPPPPFRSSPSVYQADLWPTEIPNTDPLPSPIFFASIADILSAAAPQQEQQASRSGMMTSETYYGGIGEITGSDGSVELQCKGISDVGTETVWNATYDTHSCDYADITDSSGYIRVYCASGQLTSVSTSSDDRVNSLRGQIQMKDENTRVICINDGPNWDPNAVAGPFLQIAKAGTIAWARTSSDGSLATITGKLVVADKSDFTGSTLYVEEPSRSAGIRVHCTGQADPARDATVDVSGTVATDSSGERYIEVGSNGSLATSTSSESPVTPLGLSNKDIGGPDFNVLTPGVNTPAGYGLFNIGSLVKSWGIVTGVYPSEKCFYIDDGSNHDDDGTGHVKGLRVSWAWQPTGNQAISSPSLGSYVSVTGISGCESPSSGVIIRTLRVRDNADIVTHNTPATTEVDRGLPTSNLNEAAGVSRCNIRWSCASDTSTCYGDSFSLPTGDWVVDRIAVWAVPQIPASPAYYLGDHFSSVTLYGGTTSSLSILSTGTFTAGSNTFSNPNISATAATYSGSLNYQCMGGTSNQLWQIDFSNLNWQVSGGDTCVFGVSGQSAIDRVWFCHATSDLTKPGADGLLYQFDTTNLTSGATTVDPSAWFGGNGADVSVEVFAHAR